MEKAFVLLVSLSTFNQSFYLNGDGLHSFTSFFIVYRINKDTLPLLIFCLGLEHRSSEHPCSYREIENLGFYSFPAPSPTPRQVFHSFMKDWYLQIKDKWLWDYLCSSKYKLFFCQTLLRIFLTKKRVVGTCVVKGCWWSSLLYAFQVPLLLSNSNLMEIILYSEQFACKYSLYRFFTSCLCAILPCSLI